MFQAIVQEAWGSMPTIIGHGFEVEKVERAMTVKSQRLWARSACVMRSSPCKYPVSGTLQISGPSFPQSPEHLPTIAQAFFSKVPEICTGNHIHFSSKVIKLQSGYRIQNEGIGLLA